jgi:ABC-type glycerol-3-phosphate transport system permease component
MQARYTLTRTLSRPLMYLVLLAGAITMLTPLYWMIVSSLKTPQSVFDLPPELFPRAAQWGNYPEALTTVPFLTFFKNTMTIEVFAIVGTVLSCSMAAYSFARLRWPGRDVVFVILLSVLMLPSFTTLIPNFILWQHLGAVDTLIPLIVPAFFGNSFYIFLLRQFFRGIPRELEDAARVDGAGIVRTFATIILPLSKPALAVVTIFTFIGVWDDYLGPLIYLNSESNYTLTLGLQFFLNQYGSRWDLLMAASTVVSIPMILAFLLLQRYFIEGVTLTGLKG